MTENTGNPPPEHEMPPRLRSENQPRVILFDDVSGGSTEVIIEHGGQRYVLRATRNGRLLLNK